MNAVRAMTIVESARAPVRAHVAVLLMDLIARTAQADCIIEGRPLKAGQALLGIRTVAKRLGLTPWNIRAAIAFLEQADILTHHDDVATFTGTRICELLDSETHTLLTHFPHTPETTQVPAQQHLDILATRQTHTVVSSGSSSSLSPSEPPTPALGGGTRGGNGRPKRQPVALPPVDDEAQRLAVSLAGEFYAGMDLTPTKLDISAVRVLLVGEHLTEDQVRGIIRVNHQDKNLTYWHSPSAWLKTIGNGTKPVWRHLLEVRATKVLADGNDEGLPF